MAVKGVDNSGAVLAKSAADLKSLQGATIDNGIKKDLANLVATGDTKKIGGANGLASEVKNKPGNETEKANKFNAASSEIPKIIEPKTNIFEKIASKVEKIFNPEKAPDFSKEQGAEKTKKTGLTDPTLFAANGSAEKVQAEVKASALDIKNANVALLSKVTAASDTATT